MLKRNIGLTLITALLMLSVSLNGAIAAQKPAPLPDAIRDIQGTGIFVQTGHSSRIISTFLTSGSRYLVSCGEDKAIKIWEAATGREIRTLRQSDKMTACAVFPDNQKIIAGDEKGNLHLWNMETGKSLGKFTGKSPGNLITISISPDGRHAVSTHWGGALAYWDTANKQQVFVLDRSDQRFAGGAASKIKFAAFLSDNNRIALGIEVMGKNFISNGFNVEIYDIKKRKTVRTHEILKGKVDLISFAVSPDEKYFLASLAVAKSGGFYGQQAGILSVVNFQNGNIVRELSFPEAFYGVAFSPRGDYAAAASFGEVIVYETGNWREVKKIGARAPVAFSPDGQAIVYGNDSEVAYYGEQVYKPGLDLVDLKSWKRIKRFSGNVDFGTSGKFLAQDREIISPHWLFLYWDRERGMLSKSIVLKDSVNRKVTTAGGNAFSPDGNYAIVHNDHGSYIYHLKMKQMTKMMDKGLAISDFAPDSKTFLFSTYDRKVILWDVKNNKMIRQFVDWGNREQLYIRFNQLSRDGKYATAVFQDYERQEGKEVIIVWDVLTGREVNKIKVQHSVFSVALSPDGKHMLTGEFSGSDDDHEIVMREITNGKIIRRFKGHKDIISALAFSADGKLILSGSYDQKIILWEAGSGKKIKIFAGHSGLINSLDFSFNAVNFISTSMDGTLRLWDLAAGQEIAQFITFTDGEWIVITPEGYFNASPGGAKHLNVRVGNQVYSIDNFYEKFFNPVYVASVLQGRKMDVSADVRAGILKPPEIRIVSPEPNATFTADTISITVAAKDTGGGIDEIRLYHNGKAVGGDARAVKIISKGNEAIREYNVILVDGVNTFRATGFSRDRTESNPYELLVKLTAPAKDVSLYVLAVGINKYKNPALNLNYAEPDAQGLAGFFRKQDGGLFKKVIIREIYNEQATRENIVSNLNQLQITNPQDAVLIYLAGHGESLNDKWYFIPHELTYPEREEDLKAKGLSSDDLSGYIKNIKAQKILLLVDACKSGAVLIAFRGFEDRKALSQLSRATGVHIVAASTKDQFAAEVKDLGHGVFTYTLLEGLKGKAAAKGESVTVRKLMGYVEEQLPQITKKYKQEAQYPVVDSRGMDFPLVMGK